MVKMEAVKVFIDLLCLEGLLGLRKEATMNHQEESLNINVRYNWLPNKEVWGDSLWNCDVGDKRVMVEGVNAKESSKLRVFSLGMGNRVKTLMDKSGVIVGEANGKVEASCLDKRDHDKPMVRKLGSSALIVSNDVFKIEKGRVVKAIGGRGASAKIHDRGIAESREGCGSVCKAILRGSGLDGESLGSYVGKCFECSVIGGDYFD
ncbi:hypothetical protein QYF36_025549 [Acer negundo]|nr:hypothetical protein QYF36_025549 [Acer negundo]